MPTNKGMGRNGRGGRRAREEQGDGELGRVGAAGDRAELVPANEIVASFLDVLQEVGFGERFRGVQGGERGVVSSTR